MDSNDLIAWWSGEVDSQGIFQDMVGGHHIATNQGVTATDRGVIGQAFLFEGPDKFLEVGSLIDLRPEVFTIDLWAQQLGPSQDPRHSSFGTGLGGQTGNDAALIQKAVLNGVFDRPGLSYKISWGDGTDGSIIVADVAFGGGTSITGSARLRSGVAVNDGEWVHVALTVDSDRNATLYVNGEFQSTFQGSSPPHYGTGSIVIGNRWDWDRNLFGGSTFNGCIDEVRLLGRALTAEEIADIYGSGDDRACGVANTAPAVDAFEGGSIDEGGTFVTSVTFTDDDSGAWTASVDYGDGSRANPTVVDNGFDLSHTYAQDGTYTVTVTVTDDLGAEGSSSASVEVSNVAPTVDAGPDATILEGGTFESAGSFVDPGVDDTWTATVDYGDGSGSQALELSGKTFVLSHMYAGNGSGPFTVTVSVQDDHVAAVGLMLLTVELPPEDEAEVTVVFPLTIHEATVKLALLGWWSRFSRDTYTVEGELPLELFQRFDPDSEDLTVGFAGTVLVIPAGSLHRDDHKWKYEGSWWLPGVRTMELRDDGRFKIFARGAFEFSLRDVIFGERVDFSLSLGPDIGQARIQLDAELHFKSLYTGDEYDGDGDDDYDDGDDDDDDVRSHRREHLRRFFRRFR